MLDRSIDSDVGHFGVNVVKYGPLLTYQRHLKFVMRFCVDPYTKFHWDRVEEKANGQTDTFPCRVFILHSLWNGRIKMNV